jgi:hypothetical protein
MDDIRIDFDNAIIAPGCGLRHRQLPIVSTDFARNCGG